MKAKVEGLLNPESLQEYAIVGAEEEFENAKIKPGGILSVKSNRTTPEKHRKQESGGKSGKKRSKEDHRSSKSNKKSKS